MREFADMGALAMHLLAAEARQLRYLQDGLKDCAVHIESIAKKEIGHYQAAAGPFAAWADLAESTEFNKASHGYPVDAPLLRTGDMRDEITHNVEGLEAAIGAKDNGAGKILQYHEVGTSKMPARPVLGPAMFRSKDFIMRAIGAAEVSALLGGSRIHPSLGYED